MKVQSILVKSDGGEKTLAISNMSERKSASLARSPSLCGKVLAETRTMAASCNTTANRACGNFLAILS